MRTALAMLGTSVVFFALTLGGAETGVLEKQARLGDVNAQYQLAGEYFFGRFRQVNLILAVYWFRRAADAGHPEAQYNLARCLEHGWGCRKSLPTAVKYYKKAMAKQLMPAKLRYAELLYKGVPAEKDEHGGMTAALNADKSAALQLMRECAAVSGQGRELLVKYLFMDAPQYGGELRELLAEYCKEENVHSELLVLYSSCLRAGIGGKIDIETGIVMLQRAAQKGNMEAVAQLAEAFALGAGVKYDPAKALELTRRAAKSGNQRALVNLGKAHLSGVGAEYDQNLAVNCFRQAAASGYPPALYELGNCYANGYGAEQSWQEALKNYRAAAAAGNEAALLALGDCYDRGKGVKLNHSTAYYYYSLAAEAGSVVGMRKMAIALSDGRGVRKDVKRGISLMQRAAAAGDEAARFIIERKNQDPVPDIY